jgi:3-isopropylmalate dehydrogenase
VSALWRDIGRETAAAAQIEVGFVDIDLAAYRLVQDPLSFDVIAAPNLFGDVLADLGAVLLSSRGLSFSGNFSEEGAAVYQTNHGSALDLAGQGRANPLGQIASLAMMLRESFGLAREAGWIDSSVEEVVRHGFRTFDVAEPRTTVVGTAEMGERIAAAVRRLARPAE